MTMGTRQRIAAVALLLITSASEVAVGAPPPDLKQIVVLYWYGKDFPSNVAFERGLQAALRTAAPGRAEYFPEFLESNRFPGDEQSAVLHDYLLRKYAGRRIDAVVALSSTSLDFLRRYRSDLFAGVPIVFHTFGMPDLDDPGLRSTVTGVVVDGVFRKTVDAALALHPDTREVLVIVGTPERDKKLEGDVRSELGDLDNRVAIQYLSDLSLSDVMNRVKSAPPQSLVFYVRQSYD